VLHALNTGILTDGQRAIDVDVDDGDGMRRRGYMPPKVAKLTMED
jgi:hypothetical protein